MKTFFDAHADTASKIYDFKCGLLRNDKHIDIERLKTFENPAQIFALYLKKEYLNKPFEIAFALSSDKSATAFESFSERIGLFSLIISLAMKFSIIAVKNSLREEYPNLFFASSAFLISFLSK